MRRWQIIEQFLKLGGEHSGHHGHKGVPGQRGGSAPSNVVDFGWVDIDYESNLWNNAASQIRKEARTLFIDQELSRKEQVAIQNYTQDSFREINSELRSGKLSKATQKQVAIIDEAIGRHSIDTDVYVYRGRPHPSTGDMKDPAFVSTSLSAQVASSFASGEFGKRSDAGVMRIHVPAGSNILYTSTFGGAEAKQFEVLLPRNANLKHIDGNNYEYIVE